MTEIERIKTIKRANEQRWLALEGVVAVGIGRTSAGTTGLIVSAKSNLKKIRELVPLQIEDIQVEVRETGELSAQQQK